MKPGERKSPRAKRLENLGSRENKRRWGQYFTPPEAAGFVLEAARITLGRRPETLVDPACGDGVFIETALATGLVDADRAFGIEIDPGHVRSVRRLGLGRNAACGDALSDPLPRPIERSRGEGFDLVVGNPPFGGGGGKGRPELRFVRRFAELARPGGAGAVILPSGVFANASSQKLRDSLLGEITPVAVVELPPGTFRRAGTTAATCVLLFLKKPASPSARCLVMAHGETACRGEADARRHFRAALRALGTGRSRKPARRVRTSELRGHRWDPGYWCRGPADILSRVHVPLEPLGNFVEHITYGPILTGADAERDLGGRIRVVGLRELRPAGLDLRGAKRVRAGGVHDPARCRLRPGDLVLARSGAGSLLKGRVAVFDGGCRATVGCFVDLVRLSGMEPGYAALCLRSALVRAQVNSMANGVGTPNLSFGEIRGLLIPRLGEALESALAREDEEARRLHARALRREREPGCPEGERAAQAQAEATAALEEAAFTGSCRLGKARRPPSGRALCGADRRPISRKVHA